MLKRLLQEVGRRKDAAVADGGPGAAPPTPQASPAAYTGDGLSSYHNTEFIHDPRFAAAYARGVAAAGVDYSLHWRTHIALWAAQCAARLPGDFVECGVNYGFMSSAIMHFLDWDRLGKTFWLLDTFRGMDESLITEAERRDGVAEHNRERLRTGVYVQGSDRARRNFSEWKNTAIVEGTVPQTLSQVRCDKVAFLHLDMNCAEPEVAAAEHFWPLLGGGGMILMDDYAYFGYRPQKLALDAFAASRGVPIVSLPTGQGLIIV